MNVLVAFYLASERTREKVLRCYCPPLAQLISSEHPEIQSYLDISMSFLEPAYSNLFGGIYSSDRTLALRVLAIKMFNMATYRGLDSKEGSSYEYVAPQGHSALFDVGSKFEHSCLPNARQTTMSGPVAYHALMEIKEGERLSMSYLRDAFSMPASQRRLELSQSRNFLCKCKACSGPDFSRPLFCPSKSKVSKVCGGLMYRSPTAEDVVGGDGKWVCMTCAATFSDKSPQLKEILAIESRLSTMVSMKIDGVTPMAEKQLLDARRNATANLPSSHFLFKKLSSKWAKLKVSLASMWAGQAGIASKAKAEHLACALAAIEVLLWSERNAAVWEKRITPNDPLCVEAITSISSPAVARNLFEKLWVDDSTSALRPRREWRRKRSMS